MVSSFSSLSSSLLLSVLVLLMQCTRSVADDADMGTNNTGEVPYVVLIISSGFLQDIVGLVTFEGY